MYLKKKSKKKLGLNSYRENKKNRINQNMENNGDTKYDSNVLNSSEDKEKEKYDNIKKEKKLEENENNINNTIKIEKNRIIRIINDEEYINFENNKNSII